MVLQRIVSSVLFALGLVLILRSILRWIAISKLKKDEKNKRDLDKP